MRSKRLLTMLLVLGMLVSLVTPAVNAATVSKNTVISTKDEGIPAKTETSKFDNDRVLSSEDTKTEGSKNLRDDPMLMPEVEAVKENTTTNGGWSASVMEGDLPDVSLTLPETPDSVKELKEAAEVYAADEKVAAFVVMEDKPLAERFSSITKVSEADEEKLLKLQDAIIELIEKLVLGGEKLDVRYQFTYLTNAFSVETEFGNLAEIAAMDGVKSVYLMPVYEACATENSPVIAAPTATSSGEMTGVHNVWKDLGYRGEGMKIAVIDTGLDLDHPSFAQHDDFQLTDSSLTPEKIDAVLEDLNAHDLRSTVTGETLYRSAKVPYAFNYVDESLTADHSLDSAGDHGTHVSGIAAANDNVPGTDVVGMAPEAQLIVMKVFGAAGGAYTDDILAALEDAMTLGCDVANLSLGSPAGFTSENEEIDAIYERIAKQDIIVAIAAGNEGTSSAGNMWGTDMNTTTNPDNSTMSSPATYVNTTTVASVDNATVMTPYFTVDGENVYYSDPYEFVVAMSDLAGQELEYVFVPGTGTEEDFASMDVAGKVAVIQRGTLSFAEKILRAESYGAVAAVIWNNSQDDVYSFGMQITDENGNIPYIPACLISMDDGEKMAAKENKTMVPTDQIGARAAASAGQMSSFSSWGVSPDLKLKPEISGIGGSVYSCYDGGSYGLMSGTSMATPQVAGVSALVLQYLHEKFPNAETGTLRTMAENLMMSNAEVVISNETGLEASPRHQGAGLVNAAAAVTSEAYLTVGGDKPKAEMGDSASGTFTFSFVVHNFGSEAKTYTLDASLLTEDALGAQLSETEVVYFMAGYEKALTGTVSFDQEEVTVAAGGTATVNVTITLSEDDKAWFNEVYPDGGYVEGYVYLNSEDAASLNLPFMGFYGDWTEPAVFDTAYWYDNSFWGVEPEGGIPEGNEYWHVMWTNLGGTDWVLGFNPYTGATADENGNIAYDPAHNVVSPNGDGVLDGLDEIYLSLMRNAKTLTLTYTNADTGEVLSEEVLENNSKTMFISSYGQVVPWLYSWYGYGMYDFTDANGQYLANDTNVLLTITAKVDYEDGGEHSIQIPITVDTEKPEMMMDLQYSVEGNQLMILASDNVALADVFIMNKSGTQIWAEQSEFTEITDGMYMVTIDVTGLGNEFVVVLCDYAGNEGYYELTYDNFLAGDNLPEVDTSLLYAYRTYDNYIYSDHMYGWVSLNKPTSPEEYANINVHTDDYLEYAAINAAEYVDGKIFAIDAVGNLVMMDPGLFDRTTLCNLGINAIDMTFDDSTDTMYVLSKQDYYAYLYSMDLLTGKLTLLADYGYYYYGPWAIADDDNGTIYAIQYNSANVFTLDVENGYAMNPITDADGVAYEVLDSYGSPVTPSDYAQSITYADGTLYWAYFMSSWRGEAGELIAIDVETMTSTAHPYLATAYDADGNLVEYSPVTELVGLMTLTETDYQIPDAEALESLWMEQTRLVLASGSTAELKANPIPWNYELQDLQWTSSDTSVATVDAQGNVTAVAEGNAIITAASGDVSVECLITVVDVEGSFNAYNYYSGDGNYGYMIDVDLGTMNYTLTAQSPVDFYAADYNGHDGYYYGYSEGGQFWRYDQETGEAVKLGEPIGAVPVDMAYDYSTGLMYAATVDYNMGYSSLCAVNLKNGQLLELGRLDYNYLLTLACDTEGNLYSISYEGTLLKLSLEDGYVAAEPLMEGLSELQFMQSMCYDHVNDVILWAYPEYSMVYWIDINNEYPYAVALGDPTASGLLEFVGMYTVPETIPELEPVAVESVTAEDMVMLTGTTKYPNITVMPFNATYQNVVLTSGDESVVTVDENGALTGVAEGTAAITGVLTDEVSGETFEVSFNVSVLDGADDVYGHILTDLATMGGQYWVRLYTHDPSDPDLLQSTNYIIYAEEYYDGQLYAVGYDPNDWEANWQMMVMDPVTHVVHSMTDLGEGYPFVYDMTYDYTTSTMYAVAGPSDNASDLYVFNMENGQLIPLLDTEQFFMSLAAGPDGKLYAMEPSQETVVDEWDPWAQPEMGNATLYTIDPLTGTIELVGDTGIKSNMLSSMSYDYDTGRLYWTPFFSGSSYISSLAVVEPDTGAAVSLGTIRQSGAQTAGLYIISENFPAEPEPALNGLVITPNKVSVSAGSTITVNAYTLPLSLDADFTWASSDETVATVDENGVVTALKQGKAVITAIATYNGVTKTASCNVSVLNADAAFLTYNVTDGGWAAINRGDTSVVTPLTLGETTPVAAIADVNGVVYGYDVENNFFTLDTETYERHVLGTANTLEVVQEYQALVGDTADSALYGLEIRDLAYDPANDRLLALGNVYDLEWGELTAGNGIYEVDMTTGSLTLLYSFTEAYYVMAMTVGPDGEVYFYNTFDDYYAVLDLNAGTYSNIVSLQSRSYYGDPISDHALYYDDLTGLVYHLFTSNGSYYRMFTMDPVTSSLNLYGEYVGEVIYDEDAWVYTGDLFAGLAFVDVDVSDPADPEDPVDPTDPADPSDPADPTDPENPGNPTDPADPSDPADPTDPENPSDPADPTDPEEPSDTPATGDQSDLMLWTLLMLASAMALVTMFFRKAKPAGKYVK